MNKFYLPELQTLIIKDFSLYKSPLRFDFTKKLNIVYGTNGTGKSTLLMLLLFSLVGPYRGAIKTRIYKEERRDSRPLYDEDFFQNRANRTEKEATIEVTFRINNDQFYTKHSLYNCKLLYVEKNGSNLLGEIVTYKTYETKFFKNSEATSRIPKEDELDKYLIFQYHQALNASTQLAGGINTLINMLLDVMFFDESRKFTFWDADLQEMIIGKYIVDSKFYENFTDKKLNVKALESIYKKKSETHNYMRKFFTKEREQENKPIDSHLEQRVKIEEIELDIEKLQSERYKAQELYNTKQKILINLSSKEEQLKRHLSSIDSEWYSNLLPSQYHKYYTKFHNIMLQNKCPVCDVAHKFDLHTECCVVCGEKLQTQKDINIIELDIQRKDYQIKLNQNSFELETIQKELSNIKEKIDSTLKDLNKLHRQKNEIEILRKPEVNLIEQSDSQRLDKAQDEKKRALDNLNNEKHEESTMRKELNDQLEANFENYKTNFMLFANSFFDSKYQKNLTLPFLADDLDKQKEPMIRFTLDGKERNESFTLSESQRIFTDLSFRFSILTHFHEKSFFICETPDSTLDMFHEQNAIKTFINYIEKGNSLIITANARHSNLVRDLYKSFDKSDVTVIDLTQISSLALEENFSFIQYLEG